LRAAGGRHSDHTSDEAMRDRAQITHRSYSSSQPSAVHFGDVFYSFGDYDAVKSGRALSVSREVPLLLLMMLHG